MSLVVGCTSEGQIWPRSDDGIHARILKNLIIIVRVIDSRDIDPQSDQNKIPQSSSRRHIRHQPAHIVQCKSSITYVEGAWKNVHLCFMSKWNWSWAAAITWIFSFSLESSLLVQHYLARRHTLFSANLTSLGNCSQKKAGVIAWDFRWFFIFLCIK